MLADVTGTADHVLRNRAVWDQWASNYAGAGVRSWSAAEPTWGIWGIPEAQAGVLPSGLDGADSIEMGCGTGYVSAWLARRGAQLIFLVNSVLLMLTIPDEDDLPATDRLLRPFFGMHRFEWPDDDSVEFHLGHGDMIRLLRRCGLEVEDLLELRPGPGAVASHPLATIEWARQWPCEEVWKARKVSGLDRA